MLENETLEQQLQLEEAIDYVKVTGDGYHYQITVVSELFASMKPVARQQWVYKQLKPYIVSGALHAVTINTFSKDEWEKANG